MYEHDYKGVAVFGDLDSLTSAVTTGDVIRVVIHNIHDFQVVASLVLGFARSCTVVHGPGIEPPPGGFLETMIFA